MLFAEIRRAAAAHARQQWLKIS